MKENIEHQSQNLEFNIEPEEAIKIWKEVVERGAGELKVTYLNGNYSEGEDKNQNSADVRLQKIEKYHGGGYLLYVNGINKPDPCLILNLLHKLESKGLLVKEVNVQASHRIYDEFREELKNSWREYLDELQKNNY